MTMVLSELQYVYQTENRIKQRKNRPLNIPTFYDYLHTALFAMNEYPTTPKAKNRMTLNKKVQELLIQKGFVKEVTEVQYNKLLHSRCKHRLNGPCYLITTKGHEYLKRFEHLRELFDSNE
jgi:predicted transcriptional regulator